MGGITNPTEEFFKDGVWGYDMTRWRKLALLWGYSDRWAEYVYGVATGVGNAVANTAAVPAGYVYKLEALSFIHDSGVARVCDVGGVFGAVAVRFVSEGAWASGVVRCWNGVVTLKAGDYVQLTVWTPGDGKWGYLWVCGYMMKVT